MTREQLIAEVQTMADRLEKVESSSAENSRLMDTLLESVEKYRILLDESSDPIFMFSPDGTYRYVNLAFAEGVARKQEEIIDRKIWDVFPPDEAAKRFAVVKWVFENAETRVIEVRVPRTDGDRYYITTAKPIINDKGMVTTVICISKEITERKRMEDELRHVSTHDFLTGLYNRLFFVAEMERIQNSRLFPVSIVMADLDKLKGINDSQGHQMGDAYLKKAADALKRTFRSEDIIARIGGDEFSVLLPETGMAAAADMIQRLKNEIQKESDPHFGMSVGWATGEKDTLLEDLMHQADEQMYLMKSRPKTENG